jgi:serine/threonine protein kinase
MAVGKAPYKDTSAFETQMQIINKPFPKAQDIYPRVSDKIESIINKATQKEKKDRYQSCEDFIQALNSDGISTVIINDSNEKTIVDTHKVKKGKEEEEDEKKKKNKNTGDKKSSAWKIIGFLILFAFFGGFGYYFYNNDFDMEHTIDNIQTDFDDMYVSLFGGEEEEKKKNIREFNADKIESICDIVEYQVYVYTELNELAEDSDKHNAYEMNSKSRRTAESLIREFYHSNVFFKENYKRSRLNYCEKYDELNSWYNNDFIQDFYKDMAEDIEDDYKE